MRGDVSTSLSAPSSRLKQGIMSDGGFLCNRKEYAPLPDATARQQETGKPQIVVSPMNVHSFLLEASSCNKSNTSS